jgi:DNA gyrase/topoisomerase IV subunit A
MTELQLLEAKLVAATQAPQIVATAQRAATSKAAVPLVMKAFALTEEQAVTVLDSQFRVVTAQAREQIEEQIRALKAAG